MSVGLIALVTCCYVGVAVAEAAKGNFPMATVFASYAVGNVGFMFALNAS